MVFDRRFNAASPRYLGSASNAQQQSDGLRPPLRDYCALLTRSFLMVLGIFGSHYRGPCDFFTHGNADGLPIRCFTTRINI